MGRHSEKVIQADARGILVSYISTDLQQERQVLRSRGYSYDDIERVMDELQKIAKRLSEEADSLNPIGRRVQKNRQLYQHENSDE